MSNNRTTYDLEIMQEFNFKHLTDKKIVSIDIDPVSKNVLLLVGDIRKYELILANQNLEPIKRKLINTFSEELNCPDHLTLHTVRFLPNDFFSVYANGYYSYLFLFNSSLSKIDQKKICNHANKEHYVFNENSCYVLSQAPCQETGTYYTVLKVDTSVSTPKIQFLPYIDYWVIAEIEDNNETYKNDFGIHITSDNTIIFFANNNGTLILSFGRIHNDLLIFNSSIPFDNIDSCVSISPSFSCLSDGTYYLQCSIYDESEEIPYYKIYSFKQLGNQWNITKEPCLVEGVEIHSYPFLPPPLYVLPREENTPNEITDDLEHKEYNTYRLTDLKTHISLPFPECNAFCQLRENVLIINKHSVLLASFTRESLHHEINDQIKSALPKDFTSQLIPIITSYAAQSASFFSRLSVSPNLSAITDTQKIGNDSTLKMR